MPKTCLRKEVKSCSDWQLFPALLLDYIRTAVFVTRVSWTEIYVQAPPTWPTHGLEVHPNLSMSDVPGMCSAAVRV